MAAAQDGDRAALEVLLRRHHDRLLALCRRLTGNDADAADACQEALIAVVRGLARFDGRAQFSTWAYRVATNACLDEMRRRKRRPEPDPFDSPTSPLPGSPSDPAANTAQRLDIEAALRSLPHDYRVAVVLRDQCELSYEEISETLGIPVGTVRSRISRGRATLVAALGEDRGRSEGAVEPLTPPATSKPATTTPGTESYR